MPNTSPVWQGQAHLTCLARSEETADCASFTLAVPAGSHAEFLPGQFICLGAEIDARLHLRAYSIASAPDNAQQLTVAVRRVPGGLVSNWLLDNLRPGHAVLAQAPMGEFHIAADAFSGLAAPRHVALFSAGCGITPMMSMSRWLLARHPDIEIHFFHSARDEANFIFASEIRALASAHPRLHLHAFLSREGGRMDAAAVHAALPGAGEPLLAYLCGPDSYTDTVRATLIAHGVSGHAIHSEQFFAPVPIACTGDAEQHTLNVPDFGKTLSIDSDQSLLEALEREGLPIIGACRSGACGSCRCKLLSGNAHSTTTGPLDEAALQEGYVLACCTYPDSDLSVALS